MKLSCFFTSHHIVADEGYKKKLHYSSFLESIINVGINIANNGVALLVIYIATETAIPVDNQAIA